MSKPPVVATWLVLRLATHRSNEALVGDLSEEFQRRRSRSWYWRQVLVAVIVSWWEDVRAHKLLALRAVAVGTSALWLYFRYAYYPVAHFDQWLFAAGFLDHFVGWRYPGLMEWLAGTAGTCGSFWLVGRFHRASMVVVLYLFVLLIGDVPRLVWIYSSEYPRVLFSVIPGALTVFTLFRLPMLVVGLWAARPRQARPDPVFGPVLRSW
jgi:hypothetical protein